MFAAMLLSLGAYAQKTTTVKFHDTQARALETTTSSHVKPLVVEVEVEPKRRTQPLHLTEEEMRGLNGDVSNVRSWATFRVANIDSLECDVVVAPMFEISTNEEKGGYDVFVVYYRGTFKNWRSVKEEDYEWIRIEGAIKTSEREKVEAVVKQK
jgi:hypothetical protein